VPNVLYFIFGYIGNLQCCFEFVPLHTCEDLNLTNTLDIRVTCYIEDVPLEGDLPPLGVSRWIALCHEDALIGEGGSFVTRPIRAVTIDAENGPARARGGGTETLARPQGLT
jgi:hypothetical protein